MGIQHHPFFFVAYRFSWLLTASRSLTMVCCGSDGRCVEVAETVDGAGAFFFPNQFIVVF